MTTADTIRNRLGIDAPYQGAEALARTIETSGRAVNMDRVAAYMTKKRFGQAALTHVHLALLPEAIKGWWKMERIDYSKSGPKNVKEFYVPEAEDGFFYNRDIETAHKNAGDLATAAGRPHGLMATPVYLRMDDGVGLSLVYNYGLRVGLDYGTTFERAQRPQHLLLPADYTGPEPAKPKSWWQRRLPALSMTTE